MSLSGLTLMFLDNEENSTNNMRILQIGADDFFSTYGGDQVYVKNLVDALIDAEAELAVISFVSEIIKLVEHMIVVKENVV